MNIEAMNIEITVQELNTLKQKNADFLLLDVRSPDEYAVCNLGGYLIPLLELPQRLNELNKDKHIVVHCHHGIRSRSAAEFLIKQGFDKVQSLLGGVSAWRREIDPSFPEY